jgi:hypothetical protein
MYTKNREKSRGTRLRKMGTLLVNRFPMRLFGNRDGKPFDTNLVFIAMEQESGYPGFQF